MVDINGAFKNEFGYRLKELRSKKGLSQKGLSDKLSERGISIAERTISRYENGEALPGLENLIVLAEALDTSLDYFVLGKATSDDNSYTWFDNFKRLNRLVYSLAVGLWKNAEDGRIYIELWGDEMKVYYERLQAFGVDKDFDFFNRNGNPQITIEDLDNLFSKDLKFREKQVGPTKERMFRAMKAQGIDPTEYITSWVERYILKKMPISDE